MRMPVEKTDLVDFVTHHPKSNELTLVMVETRNWNATPEGIQQLNAKLTTYADCIMSGALARQYPRHAKCPVFIRLDHFSPMTEGVAAILRRWAGRLAGIPVGICSHRMYWNW